jgi:hypothetical protein
VRKLLVKKNLLILFFSILFSSASIANVYAWSNGGYSTDVSSPKYGTHDWIAEHAKNWLPIAERKWIDDNLKCFLYGTEYPDNKDALYKTTHGYGDTTKHHNYYDGSGSVIDASAAVRAKDEYDKALAELEAGRNDTAAIYAGSMTHYIVDVAVFAHVMTSETHHSDYEDYVEARTTSYNYGVFESYLVFDGELETVSAYDASISLGRNTFKDDGGTYTAVWMDTNYDWSNPAFKNRCGESLNLATNYVTDVLYTLFIAAFGPIAPDRTPPVISNVARNPQQPQPSDTVTVTANVTDTESGVKAVTLLYAIGGGAWTSLPMSLSTGSTYTATIPKQSDGTAVQFKVKAEDEDGITAETAVASYTVHASPAAIPGFPLESIIIGIIIATAALLSLKKRRFEEYPATPEA